jgi:hypothetical protein
VPIPGNLELVRRDPRIKLTGRPCSICGQNAPIGLIVNLRGGPQLTGQAIICKGDLIRICDVIAYGQDATLNVDVPDRRIVIS